MVTLPPPTLDNYTGARVSQRAGGKKVAFTLTAAALGVTIPNLVPGHRVRVRLAITTPTPTARTVIIRVGDRVRWYPPNRQCDHVETVTVGHSLTIEVTGISTGLIERLDLDDQTPLPDNPTPRDVLSLQALYPLPGQHGLRWNTHRWNREAWTTGGDRPDTLTWDRHGWDTRSWAVTESITNYWQDITGPCTDLTVIRGVTTTGPAMSAAVGTLTAHAINALSPRATGLHHGTPIRLIHWPTRALIYTGVITDLTITPHKPGERVAYEVTLTASDNVARLAAITRYGAKADDADGSEPWTARLDRLIKSAPDLTYRVHDTAQQTVPPTVWETSLAKHLDALTASVLGSWTVDRDGSISIRVARPRSAAITLTDAEQSTPASGVWSYTDVNVAWTSSNTVAHVTLANHGATWDAEQNTWAADDMETTVDDPTAANAWGGAAISVDTTLPGADLEKVARRYLAAANSDPTPASLTLVAAHDTGPANRAAHMALAATLDPITAVNVHWRGEDAPSLITQVTHTITPTTWKTRLNLTNNQ